MYAACCGHGGAGFADSGHDAETGVELCGSGVDAAGAGVDGGAGMAFDKEGGDGVVGEEEGR